MEDVDRDRLWIRVQIRFHRNAGVHGDDNNSGAKALSRTHQPLEQRPKITVETHSHNTSYPPEMNGSSSLLVIYALFDDLIVWASALPNHRIKICHADLTNHLSQQILKHLQDFARRGSIIYQRYASINRPLRSLISLCERRKHRRSISMASMRLLFVVLP